MIGNKYGRLTVIERSGSTQARHIVWLCSCECGTEVSVPSKRLRSGQTRSCGCLRDEQSRERNCGSRLDLSGRRYGSYTVIRFHETKRGRGRSGGTAVWWCRCDCGQEKAVQVTALKYGSNPRCRQCADDAMVKPDWAIKALLKRYRYNAEARQLKFRLTDDEFLALIGQPCYYCGEIAADSISHPRRADLTFRHNGVDRINGGDYTAENSVTCCWSCNRMKGALTGKEFFQRCSTIARRLAAYLP